MSSDKLKHLGGHANITHIDMATLKFAKEHLLVSSMLDVGCGPGGQLQIANELGIEAIGIDGFPGHNRVEGVDIIIHDFCKGAYTKHKPRDLAWSCEFLEHVESKYIPNYMESFKSCDKVITTFAPRGTHGHHHVNCKDEEYWINVFEKHGFKYVPAITNKIRSLSSMKRDFIRKTGLYFEKL